MLWVFSALLMGCSAEPGVKTYAMGEKASAGQIVYSVLEARWSTQLGEGESARIPSHRYLLLRLSVTNGSAQEVSVPLTTLLSSDGETYGELTDGRGVADWLGMLRKLRPVETAFGWVIFDAPRRDYTLRVSDDAFDPAEVKTALIEVPLRFESRSDALPRFDPSR